MSKITCYIYLRYDIRNLYIYTLLTYFWPTCIGEGCREEESDIGEREKKLSFLTLFGPHRRNFHDFETIEFRDVLRGGGSKRPPLRELHNESVRRERKGKNTGWQSRLVRSRLPFLCGDRWNFGSNKERIPRGCFPSSLLPFVPRLLLAFTCLRAVRIQAAFLSPSSLLSGYINYGRCLSVPSAFAFFSSPRSNAFLHLCRTTSQRFELVIDSSLGLDS